MHPKQPKIHSDDELPSGVARFGYVKPISPFILRLAEAQISKCPQGTFQDGAIRGRSSDRTDAGVKD